VRKLRQGRGGIGDTAPGPNVIGLSGRKTPRGTGVRNRGPARDNGRAIYGANESAGRKRECGNARDREAVDGRAGRTRYHPRSRAIPCRAAPARGDEDIPYCLRFGSKSGAFLAKFTIACSIPSIDRKDRCDPHPASGRATSSPLLARVRTKVRVLETCNRRASAGMRTGARRGSASPQHCRHPEPPSHPPRTLLPMLCAPLHSLVSRSSATRRVEGHLTSCSRPAPPVGRMCERGAPSDSAQRRQRDQAA